MQRKWFRIGSGIAIGVTTIVALFALLVTQYSFAITGTDTSCLGTKESPCISYLTVRNPTPYAVDIYNPNEIQLKFSPEVPEYYLFRKDGRCKGGLSCAAPNGVSITGWNYIDFTSATKPREDTKYVFRFAAYSTNEFLLWGLKDYPSQKIKFDFVTPKGILDPIWLPVNGNGSVTLNNIKVYRNETEQQFYPVYKTIDECYPGINLSSCKVKLRTDVVEVIKKRYDRTYQELCISGKCMDLEKTGAFCWDNSTHVVCKDNLDGSGRSRTKVIKPGETFFSINYAQSSQIETIGYRENKFKNELELILK